MAETLRQSPKSPKTPKRNGPAPSGDNIRAVEEAEQAQLISVVHQLRQQEAKVEAKKAELGVERTAMNSLLDMGSAQGFPKKLLRELLKDMAVTGQRRDIRAEEVRRAQCRNWLGLPVGNQDEQAKLDLMPEEARDEMDWRGEGYAAGLRGSDPSPPDGMHTRFHQAFMTGWGEGQSKLAESLKRVATVVPEPAPEPETEEPEPTIGDERFAEQQEAARVKAALENPAPVTEEQPEAEPV